MYGQFQNQIASAAKWIFFGFIIVVVMALIIGVNIKGAKWLNREIASAEANRINIENAHQQATYELQERLANAQTEAEIQDIQRKQKLLDAQYTHDIQALTQDLEHRETAFKTWMNVLTFLGGALSIAIVSSTVLWFGSKAIATVRTATPNAESSSASIPPIKTIQPLPERGFYDPWQSEKYRREKIKESRYRERAARKAALGKNRNNLPLAG